jgi:tetratricopeptide (TPR) repeat protein
LVVNPNLPSFLWPIPSEVFRSVTDSQTALPLRRKFFYASVLSIIGLALLLGGLELGLRLIGYGHSPHFFRPAKTAEGETVWRENRWALAPFFPGALIRRPQPTRLPEKKAPGTCRIFILGSSAAMGDPEPSFSLARMLDVMLRAAYPDKKFEVVNAAVTAINSHVVRGIAEDCARLEPDLFIVYEGNNEVIGPFGPTGVLAPFLHSDSAIRAAIWLKGTRTGQLLSSLGSHDTPKDWGGMEMFLKQQITADDPRLDAVRAHFRANLEAIAASARSAGATTLLCTVATNQRDFAPFMSANGEAEKVYQLGRQALTDGHDAEARDLLQRALDLDTLRFRTDSKLNQVIRDVGVTGAEALTVVDVAAALAAKSPHGIIGNEFLYEHVHLTLRGTYETALVLWPQIISRLAARKLVAGAVPNPPSYEDTGLRLGSNIHEQTMIALEILNRFSKPPFTGQSDSAVRTATWKRRAGTGQDLLGRSDATAALREISRRALALSPDDWIIARNMGAMLVSRQQAVEALPLLERAARWIDDDVDTLIALGWAHHALGHAADSEAAFAKARALEPNYPNLPKPGGK